MFWGQDNVEAQSRGPRIPADALPDQRGREKAAGEEMVLPFSPGKSGSLGGGADVSSFEPLKK